MLGQMTTLLSVDNGLKTPCSCHWQTLACICWCVDWLDRLQTAWQWDRRGGYMTSLMCWKVWGWLRRKPRISSNGGLIKTHLILLCQVILPVAFFWYSDLLPFLLISTIYLTDHPSFWCLQGGEYGQPEWGSDGAVGDTQGSDLRAGGPGETAGRQEGLAGAEHQAPLPRPHHMLISFLMSPLM